MSMSGNRPRRVVIMTLFQNKVGMWHSSAGPLWPAPSLSTSRQLTPPSAFSVLHLITSHNPTLLHLVPPHGISPQSSYVGSHWSIDSSIYSNLYTFAQPCNAGNNYPAASDPKFDPAFNPRRLCSFPQPAEALFRPLSPTLPPPDVDSKLSSLFIDTLATEFGLRNAKQDLCSGLHMFQEVSDPYFFFLLLIKSMLVG